MLSKCLPPKTLQYLAEFHAILSAFASTSLLCFGTQPERGWADGVAPGTSEHPYTLLCQQGGFTWGEPGRGEGLFIGLL